MNKFEIPPVKSIPEIFFDALRHHIRQLEASLDEDERIAFVYSQTGENIIIEQITHEGGAIILYGTDSAGTKTSVFANMSSFQITFKIVSDSDEIERKPIGFDFE